MRWNRRELLKKMKMEWWEMNDDGAEWEMIWALTWASCAFFSRPFKENIFLCKRNTKIPSTCISFHKLSSQINVNEKCRLVWHALNGLLFCGLSSLFIYLFGRFVLCTFCFSFLIHQREKLSPFLCSLTKNNSTNKSSNFGRTPQGTVAKQTKISLIVYCFNLFWK